jgi:hypothetical protein
MKAVMSDHVAYTGVWGWGAFEVLESKLKEKRTFGILRHRWDYNIRVDIKKCVRTEWTRLIYITVGQT